MIALEKGLRRGGGGKRREGLYVLSLVKAGSSSEPQSLKTSGVKGKKIYCLISRRLEARILHQKLSKKKGWSER